MFRRKDCCVLTPRAQLDLARCAKRHVPSKKLLHSHAADTLGSLSLRKQEDMFMRQTAAVARCEHTWISFRAKNICSGKTIADLRTETCSIEDRKDCCDFALLPKMDDFTFGRQIQFLESSARTSLTLSGTRDPRPGHRALALQIVEPRNAYAAGEYCYLGSETRTAQVGEYLREEAWARVQSILLKCSTWIDRAKYHPQPYTPHPNVRPKQAPKNP